MVFSRQPQLPCGPSRRTGLHSTPGVCLASFCLRLSPGLPSSALSSGQAPVLCHGGRAPQGTASPHAHMRGLRDERLLNDRTVISGLEARAVFLPNCVGRPRTAPGSRDSQHVAVLPAVIPPSTVV